MAYDPEARKDSNTALIAGVAALILVIAAVAYFATRPAEVVDNTVVVTPSSQPRTVTNTVIEQVPVVVDAPTAAPPVVIQAPDRIIERDTNTTTTTNRVIVATPEPSANDGAPDGAAGRSSTNTNVTVNVPPPNEERAPAPRDGGVKVEGNAGNAPAGNAPPAPRDSGY